MGVGDTAVETERLRLRRWRADDADAFAAINAAPEVMRYIGSGATLDRAGSDELLVRLEREWEERGFGLWAVEERVAGPRPPLLGFCGLTVPMFLPEVLPAVEVGWRLALPAWGRGIATEAATAALDHGFGALGMREIIAIVDPRNRRSLRVCAKVGMEPRPARTHPGTGRRLAVFGARAPELQ